MGDTTTSENISPGIGAYQLQKVHTVLTELSVSNREWCSHEWQSIKEGKKKKKKVDTSVFQSGCTKNSITNITTFFIKKH